MGKNWAVEEAKRADLSKNYVILENPKTQKYLDNLLMKEFWPSILSDLESSGFNYYPQDTPEPVFELQHVLTRSLTFMLLNGKTAFFRGKYNSKIGKPLV